MIATLQDLRERAAHDPQAVESFLTGKDFPLVEGSRVTFAWRGQADAVWLQHWIYGLEQEQPFERVQGTDLWTLVMDIPPCSRVEYKLAIERGGGRAQLVQDPLNPNHARDPYGANSVVYGEGYETPDWLQPDPDARVGEIQELTFVSDLYNESRPISVYLPARFRETRRYPLLVVHDGQDYLRFTEFKTVLDNLIHRLELPPVIVAFTQSKDRLNEYSDDEKHADFLVNELVPVLEERYPLVGTPSARGLMGASFGAVASLSCAWRHQGFFGNLMLQSGSFAFTDIGDHDRGPLFDPVVEFTNAFREKPGKPAEKVYLSCGTYESLIYYNRSMVPLLQETGMQVRFTEARDGHNWENWRDRLREGLSWLFPGPLWLVYE